jgi:plasmid maintenance system killer protein
MLARKRLRWRHAATSLTDLAAIRGNRLEALKGSRAGRRSIRINDRWRICFSWREGNAYDGEIVDHRRRGTIMAQRNELPPIQPGELLRDELNEVGVSRTNWGARFGSR